MVEIKEYCGWKYMHNKETAQYFIDPNEKMECPQTFFKYYSLSKNSVEALTNAYIYMFLTLHNLTTHLIAIKI